MWEQRDTVPLIRGDRLAALLEAEPGPEIGRLLAEIDEARFAGEVSTTDQAVAYAHKLYRGQN